MATGPRWDRASRLLAWSPRALRRVWGDGYAVMSTARFFRLALWFVQVVANLQQQGYLDHAYPGMTTRDTVGLQPPRYDW